MARVVEEDLRSKNMPFTVGNIIRITFNFFLLPTLSLALYQLVIAGNSAAYAVALAVILILAILLFALWMIRLIVSARPRAYLFDDLPTVLLYGPLYNTYRDDVAPFALVPIFITFLRAIAIGALQPSGVAQVVLLAICEVAMILLLVAFRPYASPTSMNLYQLVFSVVRFLVVLLSVTFVPSLGISEQTKGWIGYAILILHGAMLVFGFFLNALQTLIEVIARLAGAGGVEGGATRGGLTKVRLFQCYLYENGSLLTSYRCSVQDNSLGAIPGAAHVKVWHQRQLCSPTWTNVPQRNLAVLEREVYPEVLRCF